MIERPRLVGLHEIQQRLQLSRQRIQQLTGLDGFPPPYQELAMGRVWLQCDVEAWIQEHRPHQACPVAEDSDP